MYNITMMEAERTIFICSNIHGKYYEGLTVGTSH